MMVVAPASHKESCWTWNQYSQNSSPVSYSLFNNSSQTIFPVVLLRVQFFTSHKFSYEPGIIVAALVYDIYFIIECYSAF